MSQYPSPYSPPPYPPQAGYYPAPQANPLAPARRASLLMFILGPLMTLMGGCLTLASFGVANVEFPPEQRQLMQQLEMQSGMPAAALFFAWG